MRSSWQPWSPDRLMLEVNWNRKDVHSYVSGVTTRGKEDVHGYVSGIEGVKE